MAGAMNDRAARIAMLLGFVPLIVAIFYMAGVIGDLLGQDGLQSACLVASVALCALTLRVWRRYVRWTGPRIVSTFALGLLVIAQVVIWQPIWAVGGCGADDVLRFGQSSSLAGLWCVAAGLIWWAEVLLSDRRRRAAHLEERTGMSANMVRLAMGMALMPLLPGVFIVVGVTVDHFTSSSWPWAGFVAYEVCAVIAVGVWLALWRRVVHWTPARRRWTLLLAAAAAIVPASVLIPDGSAVWSNAVVEKLWDAVRNVLPLLVLAAWLSGTAWIWRTHRPAPGALTHLEGAIRCPDCGYSLVGLREVRCPECGWSSTVDDIVGRSLSAAVD
ncbi:MAG TPA: hypothetical protein VGM03_16010 [Phycisphaerae bacterium]